MVGPCPYDCFNKTQFGYCKTTGCINPKYMSETFLPSVHGFDPSNRACQYCANNPANGGSGICHCVLGNPVIY